MLAEKNVCTGCGACAVSCPVNCIEMKADSEGFRYPMIDSARCISCKKCESVCPVLNKPAVQIAPQAYGVKHREERIRTSSSSGGVFPAMAEYVLAHGGAVCGAAYREDFSVRHQIIEAAADISKLQGAKYAQSSAEHLFEAIRNMLRENRLVLFSGTPCQIAGLKAFLGRDYDQLLLVDMICHGVPSPLVWKRYLAHRMEKDANGSCVISVNQRDKVSGWSRYRYSLKITYGNGKVYCVAQSDDMYMQGFVNNLFLRPSCAQCQFKGLSRCSDITLGDYWGVWDQYPEFDDNKGTSLMLTNTGKGTEFLKRVEDRIDKLSVNVQDALAQNPSAYESSVPHLKRKVFFERLGCADVEQLITELLFGVSGKRHPVRNWLKKIIGK